ncbi:MAG: glycosyltransferase family 39 protein [Polyangiaceae bacterium]
MTNVVDPYASTVYLQPAGPPSSSTSKAASAVAPSRDYVAAFVIAGIALLLRLYVAYQFASEPVWDGHYYHFGAARLAHGLGYSEDVFRNDHWVWKPWTHYPVGYSFFLSVFYRVFGTHVWVAVIANAVVGALTVFAIHRLAHRFLGKTRARIAAVLAAVHPGLLLYTAVVMSEPLAAALVIGGAWAVASARPRALALAAGGLLLGASVLVRPSSLLAVPLMFLFTSGGLKRRLVETAVVCAFCFAAILPWTYRNCRKMDGCALVSTNAGWNLAIGALTDTGRFRPLRASDGCPVVTGQVQQDRCFWDRGVQVILGNPMRWLSLAPEKLAQTFDHESFAVEYLRESSPMQWPESRRVDFREKLTLAHRLVLWLSGLSVIGLGISRSAWKSKGAYVQLALLLGYLAFGKWLFDSDTHPFHWVAVVVPLLALVPLPGRPRVSNVVGFALGFLALTALTHVVFFGDDRYHLVVTPLLCLLVAAGLRQAEPQVTSG